jgi:hypothetical protein
MSNAQAQVNRSKAGARMMASLTASTDEMKKKLHLRRQTLTIQPKIGLRRSINHVLRVKNIDDALEINQIDVSALDVSFS